MTGLWERGGVLAESRRHGVSDGGSADSWTVCAHACGGWSRMPSQQTPLVRFFFFFLVYFNWTEFDYVKLIHDMNLSSKLFSVLFSSAFPIINFFCSTFVRASGRSAVKKQLSSNMWENLERKCEHRKDWGESFEAFRWNCRSRNYYRNGFMYFIISSI